MKIGTFFALALSAVSGLSAASLTTTGLENIGPSCPLASFGAGSTSLSCAPYVVNGVFGIGPTPWSMTIGGDSAASADFNNATMGAMAHLSVQTSAGATLSNDTTISQINIYGSSIINDTLAHVYPGVPLGAIIHLKTVVAVTGTFTSTSSGNLTSRPVLQFVFNLGNSQVDTMIDSGNTVQELLTNAINLSPGVWELDNDYANGSSMDLSTLLLTNLIVHGTSQDFSPATMDAIMDYSHTARITSIEATFNGAVLPGFVLDGESGGVYGTSATAPEPATFALAGSALLLVLYFAKRNGLTRSGHAGLPAKSNHRPVLYR